MKIQKSILLLLIGVCLLGLTACNAPVTPTAEPTLDVAAIKQEIYSTLVAQLTADAPKATPTAAATATAAFTATSEASPTAKLVTVTVPAGSKSATPKATFTAVTSGGRIIYPTFTVTPYTDRATLSFQVPADGTVMAPGQDFDVKWVIRNDGFRAWNNSFYVQYYGGLASRTFSTNAIEALGIGEEMTVVADFRAPTEPGNYVTYWRLYNDDAVTILKFNFAFSVK